MQKGVKSTMYNVHHRNRHHYVRYIVVGLCCVVLAAGFFTVRGLMQPNTHLTQAPPVVLHVSASPESMQQITKDGLSFDLPDHWSETAPPHVAYHVDSWRGDAGSNDAARRLDIYIDTLPADLAVNRLLPVRADGDRLDVAGVVSDNCVNFTDQNAASAQTGKASSKWAGVNFWCDVANNERDVVAIGSTEAINTVTITGRITGAHQILVVYTDNSASPDYALFAAIIKSLVLI